VLAAQALAMVMHGIDMRVSEAERNGPIEPSRADARGPPTPTVDDPGISRQVRRRLRRKGRM